MIKEGGTIKEGTIKGGGGTTVRITRKIATHGVRARWSDIDTTLSETEHSFQ